MYRIMLGSKNPELCTVLKTKTQNFFKPTNAFNSENIVQVCLVYSQTNSVNKDFSNSVKDHTFQIPSDHFLVWGDKRLLRISFQRISFEFRICLRYLFRNEDSPVIRKIPSLRFYVQCKKTITWNPAWNSEFSLTFRFSKFQKIF